MSKFDRVLYFDGVCNLCNHFVDWVIRRNNFAQIRVASLQGEHAKNHLPLELRENMTSVVYQREGKNLLKSDAALWILKDLQVFGALPSLLLWTPSSLRNFIYDLIAKSRYSVFGKRESCRLPTPQEKEYFLD